jgi:LDH2 family malate/lactate/ureidoglycolate dehydrogenase
MSEKNSFSAATLERFARSLLADSGLAPDHCDTIAHDLVKANLRGVDSHGISRVPMYLERLDRGLVNPTPDIKLTNVAAAVSQVDADNAMGFVPAHMAMDEACRLAGNAGIGMVGVKHSTHFGMAALYVLQALEQGYISMVFTNSSPAIPMWGGRTTFLGASPLAVGFPGHAHAPFLMDMAMTVIARGKVRLAAQRGEAIPEGLALDIDGNPTTDAAKAFEGVCLPFGGVKGSVLATMMDLMAGLLTGANFGGDVKSLYFDHGEPQNVGHTFMAIRPDLFMSRADYDSRMDEFYERAQALPKASGVDEILMPGEPEVRKEADRRANGIPLTDNVLVDLNEVAKQRGLPLLEVAS